MPTDMKCIFLFMLVRMLYSCLVDADYIDIERFVILKITKTGKRASNSGAGRKINCFS